MNEEWKNYWKEHKTIFIFMLILLCLGIIIQFGLLQEQQWCYKDAIGKTLECNANKTYLAEKYNMTTDTRPINITLLKYNGNNTKTGN